MVSINASASTLGIEKLTQFPSKYFSSEIMDALDKKAKEKFCYGIGEGEQKREEKPKPKTKSEEELAETIALIDNEVE